MTGYTGKKRERGAVEKKKRAKQHFSTHFSKLQIYSSKCVVSCTSAAVTLMYTIRIYLYLRIYSIALYARVIAQLVGGFIVIVVDDVGATHDAVAAVARTSRWP